MRYAMKMLTVLVVIVAMVLVPVVAVAQGTTDAAPAKSIGSLVWGFLNSALGIGILAGGLLWVLNMVYAKKPLWQSFEGIIINAVKTAEKAIPDDTPNKAAARLDSALKLVIATYEEYQKRKATDAEVLALKNGISIVHDKLDAAGTL